MDYDKVFENNLDRDFFYTNYPGNKMVVGKISLKNAKARLNKNEYYVLVTYNEGEDLPEQYIPLSELKSDDGTLFATVNPDNNFFDICENGSIQRISRLPDLSSGSPNYLLGPGPNKVALVDLVMKQYEQYNESKNQTDSSKKEK